MVTFLANVVLFIRYLLDEYSLKPTMLLVGAILLNVCVAACCFRQPESLQQKKRERLKLKANKIKDARLLGEEGPETRDLEVEDKTCCDCRFCPDFRFSLLKKPRFALYVIAFTLYITGAANNLILIPSHTKALGFSKSSVALALSLFGGFEIFSRIIVGLIADKKLIRPQYIYVICLSVGSLFAFIAPVFTTLEYMCLYSSVMGFFPASFWSLAPIMIIDAVGLDNFPGAYGIVMVGLAFGMSVSHPTIGKEYKNLT